MAGTVQIAEGVRLDPAPGHTPGSQTITVSSRGASALSVGDIVHHPLQIMNPTWNSIFGEDAALARQSRAVVFERVVEEQTSMIPRTSPVNTWFVSRAARGAAGLRPLAV